MAKFIYITTENKYVYKVPARVVAESRAEHYKEDGYEEEYKYTMESDFELSDWFNNNMDWDDVKKHAVLVSAPEQDEPVVGQDETEIVNE